MVDQIKELGTTAVDHSAAWDWENKHVNESYQINGKSADAIAHDIVESGTVLICAAPASLKTAVDNVAKAGTAGNMGVRIVPIGMVEQASVAQSKPLSRIFEIGSKLSYIIPGRTVGQIALARVLFDGPSLLKCLYQGEVAKDSQLTSGQKNVKFLSDISSSTWSSPDEGFQAIGSGQLAMNLASTFFDQKTGLVFFFRDRQSDSVATMYFEGCQVSTHSLGIAAGMNVITESVSMEFVRAVPVITSATIDKPYLNPDQVGKLFDIPVIGV